MTTTLQGLSFQTQAVKDSAIKLFNTVVDDSSEADRESTLETLNQAFWMADSFETPNCITENQMAILETGLSAKLELESVPVAVKQNAWDPSNR